MAERDSANEEGTRLDEVGRLSYREEKRGIKGPPYWEEGSSNGRIDTKDTGE